MKRVFEEIQNSQSEKKRVKLEYSQREFDLLKRALEAEKQLVKIQAKVQAQEAQIQALQVKNQLLKLRATQNESTRLQHNSKKSLVHGRSEFPWLQNKSSRLPLDIFKYILQFMQEDTLFKLRCLSRFCYRNFYNRKRYENDVRVLRLAKMDRRFSSCTSIFVAQGTSVEQLATLNRLQFPSLKYLVFNGLSRSMESSIDPFYLPSHPTLTAISCVHYAGDITAEKYPSLESLRIVNDKERLFALNPHKKLQNLELQCQMSEEDYALVTKEQFPSLKRVTIWRRKDISEQGNALNSFKQRLTSQGVIINVVN